MPRAGLPVVMTDSTIASTSSKGKERCIRTSTWKNRPMGMDERSIGIIVGSGILG